MRTEPRLLESRFRMSATPMYIRFPETHWSLVRRAGMNDPVARREALELLLHRYLPALRSYLFFVKRVSNSEIDDVLQAFVADKIIEEELVTKADATRGRFRTLLIASLNNFLTDRYRRHKRMEAMITEATNVMETEPWLQVESEWARLLVQAVTDEMQRECERIQRPDIWTIFERRLLHEEELGAQPASYAELTSSLQLASPTQAANLLVTGKRMYARLMRAAIAEYEPDAEAIEQEIAYLREVLRRSTAQQAGG